MLSFHKAMLTAFFTFGFITSALGACEPTVKECSAAPDDTASMIQKRTEVTNGLALAQDSKVGECMTFCANKVADGKRTWDDLCTWQKCMDCSECVATEAATTEAVTTTDAGTTATTTTWQSPYHMMQCSGTQILTTESMTFAEYDAAIASVQTLYNSLDTTCTATDCKQADFAGCVLRIAGHDFMDYKEGEGGSDGCIDLHDGDNAGLAECIYEGEHGKSVADAYAAFCTTISLADFFVIAAEAVMGVSRQHVLNDDATRTAIDFRSNFKYGRTTAKTCEFAEGRLPNPENSCTAVETTFVTNMGLTWQFSAALMGVHTLGRAHLNNSGYNGWWSDAVNSRKFNNDYYVSIIAKGWAPEKGVDGNPAKNQWQRVDQGVDEATLGKEMMLNTDMCLYFTMDDAGAVELDAATAEENGCNCTWAVPAAVSSGTTLYNDGIFCGGPSTNFRAQRPLCCGGIDENQDCGLPATPMGPAASHMRRFANDEDAWILNFVRAWVAATGNGFALQRLND